MDKDITMTIVFPYNDKEGVKDVQKVLEKSGYDCFVADVKEEEVG